MFIYILIPLLISIMLYTLAERKVQGVIQHRIGPNIVGPFGLLQPLVDGVKLIFKELIIPQKSYMIIFLFSPILSFVLSLMLWYFLLLVDTYLGILIILAIGGVELYGILLGGWSSQNKFTLIGCIRTTSQLVSYELILGIIYFIFALTIGSFRIYYFYWFPLINIWIYFPLYIITLIIILAETNRAPFDLGEAESESVSGFQTEYSMLTFALYFLAEYSNMIFLSYIFSIFYTTTLLLIPFHLFFFIWIRASLPRIRYDHLITLCWYHILPISIGLLIINLSIITSIYI